jgi:hypothetical protein
MGGKSAGEGEGVTDVDLNRDKRCLAHKRIKYQSYMCNKLDNIPRRYVKEVH